MDRQERSVNPDIEDWESSHSIMGCFLVPLNFIIAAVIALFYAHYEGSGTFFGVFIFCSLVIVPIPILFIKFMFEHFVSEQKEAEILASTVLIATDTDTQKEFIKKSIPSKRLFSFISCYVLVAILFIIAMGDMEEWYYILLRLITSGVCVYSAVKFKTEWTKWIFGGLAVLYNPILPVHLGDKEVWVVINLATVAYLWFALWVENKKERR